jgi:hypothetical protein
MRIGWGASINHYEEAVIKREVCPRANCQDRSCVLGIRGLLYVAVGKERYPGSRDDSPGMVEGALGEVQETTEGIVFDTKLRVPQRCIGERKPLAMVGSAGWKPYAGNTIVDRATYKVGAPRSRKETNSRMKAVDMNAIEV